MKKLITLSILTLGMSLFFSSCVYEETVVVAPVRPDVDLYYDFWAGPRHVEIDGELFNDGNTFVRAVQLEVRLYDEFARMISTDWITVDVFINPGEVQRFSFNIPERYVFDVDILVREIFI
ncbi:MAG: hypothetical protein H6606_02015 [Flavobacteriales bacterium]|nr:hypothetical protein [Flavobacteriales bacterium]